MKHPSVGPRLGGDSIVIPVLMVVLAAIGAAFVYWSGLKGGFLLDDFENFRSIEMFLDGQIDAYGVVFTNTSGLLGRPVSMASFLGTGLLFGMDPFAFKATNLAIHIFCGVLVAWFVFLVGQCAGLARNIALRMAVISATVWLLLPIHVSTVLYPVQRMAQLGALFLLLGLVLYVKARVLIEHGQERRGLSWIMIGVPLITVVGAYSKENGALLPLLCTVVEWTLFSRSRKPRALVVFHIVLVVLPALLVLGLLVFTDRLTQGYEARGFSLVERVLSQPRVLWAYVRAILLPDGPSMGLIHDDVVVSRSLVQPWTTLPAVSGWMAACAIAWRIRKGMPLVSLGIGLFLAGHAMESTVFPLELYFEHRNYFPSVGLLVAVAGGVNWLASEARSVGAAVRWMFMVGIAAFVALLGFATFARAGVWSSWDLLLDQGLRENPGSVRMHAMIAARALETGDLERALVHFDRVIELDPAREPAVVTWRMFAHCRTGVRVPAAAVEAWVKQRPSAIDITLLQAITLLGQEIESGKCQGVDPAAAATVLESWIDATTGSRRSVRIWRSYYTVARLMASAGRWEDAARLADLAYDYSAWNPDVGILRFQIATSMSDRGAAIVTVERLRSTVPAWNKRVRSAIDRFDAYVRTMPES